MLEANLDQFVSELDVAIQAHLEWSRRVLRCAVLRTSPGDDVMKNEAHTLSLFGRWFTQNRADFEELNADRTRLLESEHQAMHDAIRAICSCVLEGKPGEADDLDMFQTAQRLLIDHLAYFKTLAITRSSQKDALTGLPLRHRMGEDFDLLTKHSQRHGSMQVVMMVDVDHFKAINDRHGHGGGDIVLQHLAATLKRVLRANDLIYRYGGEEFLLLMGLSAMEDAEKVAAQRVLDAVRALSVTLPNDVIVHPTVTIGIALVGEDESLAKVIQRADAALYTGKASGRNRYVVAAKHLM